MTYAPLSRDGLKLFGMKRCSACGDVKHVSEFYAGHRDSRCKDCKKNANLSFERGMEYRFDDYHAYAVATRRCRRCHYWYAPYSVLWSSEHECAFCAPLTSVKGEGGGL